VKDLHSIIQSLSKEEIRFYKLFVGRTNQSKERKDLKLFDIIKKNSDQDYSKKAIESLAVTSNNFYQLKNRIYHDVNNSMIWQHISKDQQSKSFSYILLSRVFRNKGELDLAYHYLLTAEKEAIKLELFEILAIVYSDIIELSHELISIDLDKYLNLKKENSKVRVEIEDIDSHLAKLMYDIKTKQNFSKSDPALTNFLSIHHQKKASDKKVLESPRFKLRLFKMYSRLLLQEKDYVSLEKYLNESYQDFTSNNLFNRHNHNDKLTLLTYLTNSLFKNEKFSKSLEVAELLHQAMKEHDKFLYEKYIFYYYNALVLNYAKEDKDKALEILQLAKSNEIIKKLPGYTSFIYLNTALIYYYQEKYTSAKTNISRLIQQVDFLSLDVVFQFKLLIVELIIRLKLDQNDIIIQKMKDIKSNYINILSDKKYHRDVLVLETIGKIINGEKIDKKNLLIALGNQLEIDIIDYTDWAKSV
jgi:hypothetical protein